MNPLMNTKFDIVLLLKLLNKIKKIHGSLRMSCIAGIQESKSIETEKEINLLFPIRLEGHFLKFINYLKLF